MLLGFVPLLHVEVGAGKKSLHGGLAEIEEIAAVAAGSGEAGERRL